MLHPLREPVVSFLKAHKAEGFLDRAFRVFGGKEHRSNHFAYENARNIGFDISKSGNPFAKFTFSLKGHVDFSLEALAGNFTLITLTWEL